MKATTSEKEKKRGRSTPARLLHRAVMMAHEVRHRISRDDDRILASRIISGSAPLPRDDDRILASRIISGSAPLPRVPLHPQLPPKIMDPSHNVSLDINKIATSLRVQLKSNKVFSPACCIYRVPARLRRLNEEAYTPRVVSIGPLHHGKENLKAMEDHKKMYLKKFLERSKVSVEDLIKVVADNEIEVRDCYAETIDLSREDFATMILLDAVFVIMVLLLCSSANRESHECGSGDQIFFRPFKFVDVVFDMCLLENQLPFFILEKFFERSRVAANPKNCTSQFLHGIMEEWVKKDSWETINSEILHFVDFIRKCQQPLLTERSSEERKTGILRAPAATELHQSGVKFKNSGSKSLLDVSFKKGILEIPQLTIHARTETIFRNLQAFEQCHHISEKGMFVNDYITFISCLARAPNDVEVLARDENLKIMLNSNEAVSHILYNLDKEDIVTQNSIFWDVCKDLNDYCRKPRHKWMATLKQVYFNNPWTGISVVAAAFLLILTVIQTVCSILQL